MMRPVQVSTVTSPGNLVNKKAAVQPRILQKLKKVYGDTSPIGEICDKRVLMLRDAYILGKKTPVDPESVLGDGWLETEFYGNGRAFMLSGHDSRQTLEFDCDKGRIELSSAKPGIFDAFSLSGGAYQTIIMRRDGTIMER